MTELRIMQECFTWFWNTYPHLRGLFFRIKNEGTNRISGAVGKATGIVPGVSDMILLCKGTAVFIEFKTPEGKQSKSQKDWQNTVGWNGYAYYLVRSLKEFQTLCQKLLTPWEKLVL
jgi:hypothetical protein